MASLVRMSCRQVRNVALNLSRQRKSSHITRCISTSKGNKDVASVTGPIEKKEPWQIDVEKEVAEETKDWVSFGYSLTDRDEDEWTHHLLMFTGITVALVGGAFVLAYLPDHNLRDWANRESYLELARREAEGLPLVDPNYVPVDQIDLPSDEELGDTEIIV